jgi:hypothetical protein
VAERGIRCGQCGAPNDVLAVECRKCGSALVDYGSEQWAAEAEHEEERTHQAAAAARTKRNALLVVLTLVVLAVGGAFVSWALDNTYIFTHEPTYAGETAGYWVKMLGSPDHYIRRRAALALESICERFSKPAAREVVPALREALGDEDEEVRKHAQNALAKIENATGER